VVIASVAIDRRHHYQTTPVKGDWGEAGDVCTSSKTGRINSKPQKPTKKGYDL
jgi:hypothetical protein